VQFSDLALSRRLERAEGYACAEFAEARRQLFPASGAEWVQCGGAYVVFDGAESPVTQTFGLGLFEELTPAVLDEIEGFFLERRAPVLHEVSPFAGAAVPVLLCRRNYRPLELSTVLFRPIEQPATTLQEDIAVRVIGPEEAATWADVSARGWGHDHPELMDFLRELGTISTARKQSFCFLAELNGTPGAAGALSLHQGVALFAGSATVPEMRRRGLQGALLHARMQCAFDYGCQLAMMVALPGSESQRNAERKGFRIAYTRTKWQLQPLENAESAPRTEANGRE